MGTCRHHSVHSMQGSSVRARAAAWNSTHTVQHWLHWAMVWLQEGESLVSCSSTKAATIATTADANVHRVLLHMVLRWIGNNSSRHMTQAMSAGPGAVQVDRLGTCRHHSVHSMQGSSVRARAAAWNSTHTVQHWLHWAMVWLQEGESLVSCSSTKAATIATTADAKVHRVLLHTVLLLCHLPELAGRRRRPSGLGGLATTRVVIWLRL